MRVLVLAALLSCSCSILGMDQVPRNRPTPPTKPLQCTDSKMLPAGDAVLGTTYWLGGLFLSWVAGLGDYPEENSNVAGPIFMVAGSVHLISFLAGNGYANDCRKAKATEQAPVRAPAQSGAQ